MFPWHMGTVWVFGAALIWGLLWIAVIVAVVVLVIRWLNNPARHTSSGSPPAESAEDLLRRRFAAGEIDEEEYARRLEVLRKP